jgi:hypothetical protein
MKQLKWAYFQIMLWAVELKLWMDGMPWEDVRFIVAERLKDLARATHEGSELQR